MAENGGPASHFSTPIKIMTGLAEGLSQLHQLNLGPNFRYTFDLAPLGCLRD